MKKFKDWLIAFLTGALLMLLGIFLIIKNNINNITIKRQKIKNSDGSKIDISDIGKQKKGLFKRLKNRKNGNISN